MTNFTPLGPLATAAAPIESTIVVIGAPAVVAAMLVLGLVLGTVLCVALLRARRHSNPQGAAQPEVAMHYVSAGRAR